MEQLLFLIFIVWLSFLFVFGIWCIKYEFERKSLKRSLDESMILSGKADKFNEYAQELKRQIDNLDKNNLTLQDTQFLLYFNSISPTLIKYKNDISDKMEKLGEELNNKSIRLDNTFKTTNFWLTLISFGTLKLAEIGKEE